MLEYAALVASRAPCLTAFFNTLLNKVGANILESLLNLYQNLTCKVNQFTLHLRLHQAHGEKLLRPICGRT